MDVEDARQGFGKKPAKIMIKFKDKGSGLSKKIEKTKISKRKADEEATAKARAEEEDAIRKSNEKKLQKEKQNY
ncbi:hypothetical protein Tco_0657631 [Tanacetum coccineum]